MVLSLRVETRIELSAPLRYKAHHGAGARGPTPSEGDGGRWRDATVQQRQAKEKRAST
jgi:hypothetical protein